VTVLENNSWYNVLAVIILRKQLEKQGQLICGFFIQILRMVDSRVWKKREEQTKLENTKENIIILHNSFELKQIIDLILH
jgi:hypothetical protein